jgi:hypothetical protein
MMIMILLSLVLLSMLTGQPWFLLGLGLLYLVVALRIVGAK